MGTELLLGQIANTNAKFISTRLASIGVDVYFHTVVGDNIDRIAGVITRALERSDVVIVTGGLGPTPDDVTREAVSAAAGRRLKRDERLAATIREKFEASGRALPEDNLRQADLPEGAEAIPPEGTAPGFYLDAKDTLLIALPGVPWEMEAMLEKAVIRLLRARAPSAAILSREILVVGLGESHVHARIADLVASQTNPTIAFLAGGGQVRVRVTAKAADERGARALVASVEEPIRQRLGPAALDGHPRSIADALAEQLRARHKTIAAAESLTGGLVGAELMKEPEASGFFLGSLVCYSIEAKRDVARIDEAILKGPGPVSKEAAGALAEAAASAFDADLGVSTTGVAGPQEHDGKPVGTVYAGAALGATTWVEKVRAVGDRANICAMAVTGALDLARRLLESQND